MIALLLLATALSQVPCAPSDSTVACQCKQGVASACEVLAETNAELARKIAQAAAMAKAAKEAGKVEVPASVDVGCGDPNDPRDNKCTGQLHHVISKTIWTALEANQNLRGKFQPRDPRFVTRATDQKAHCGWWGWHSQLDREIAKWIGDRPALTPEQFLAYLREVYSRPEMLARFPNGF